MRIWPDCIPCIVSFTLDVARPLIGDERRLHALMREILKLKPLRGEEWDVTPPEVLSDAWLMITEFSGETDPLKALKAEQNHRAMQFYRAAEELVVQSPDPFMQALKLALAANSFDAMGQAEREDLRSIAYRLSDLPMDTGSVEALRARLHGARKMVYLGDNCGEIVLDKLVIEVMQDAYDLDIVFVTRTVPSLNDATLEDALEVGLDKIVQVMENGILEPLPGTVLHRASPQVAQLMREADLVIAKGGGNFDTLTEEDGLQGRISYLLQAKCHPYCSIHRSPLGALVVCNT
jgi:uncharacterized protein with ATP-grasp and redox domains